MKVILALFVFVLNHVGLLGGDFGDENCHDDDWNGADPSAPAVLGGEVDTREAEDGEGAKINHSIHPAGQPRL